MNIKDIKLIAYVNALAVVLYIAYLYYMVSLKDGHLNAVIFSCAFIVLFSTYFPIRSALLKHYNEKKIFWYQILPFTLVAFALHSVALD